MNKISLKDREEILKRIDDKSTSGYVVIEGHRLTEYEEDRITVLVEDAKKFCASVLDERKESYEYNVGVSSGNNVLLYVIQKGKLFFPSSFESRLMHGAVVGQAKAKTTTARMGGLVSLYRNVIHFKMYTASERFSYLEYLKETLGDIVIPPKMSKTFSKEIKIA